MKNGKKVHLISADIYLKVDGGLPQEATQYLQSQLYQYLTTDVKDWAIVGSEDPYGKDFGWIMKFDSVSAAIFSYFLLDHYQYSVKFIRGAHYFVSK